MPNAPYDMRDGKKKDILGTPMHVNNVEDSTRITTQKIESMQRIYLQKERFIQIVGFSSDFKPILKSNQGTYLKLYI